MVQWQEGNMACENNVLLLVRGSLLEQFDEEYSPIKIAV